MKTKKPLIIASAALLLMAGAFAAGKYVRGERRCRPASDGTCLSCKDCSACKNCHVNGGVCSVCVPKR